MINTINSGGQVVTPWGVGDWDRAIILTLTLTGRRRAEVLNLKAGDLTQYGDAVLYGYRGKGGKQGKRELPQPAVQAIQVALAAFGKDLANMKPGESLWPSSASSGRPAPVMDAASAAAPSTGTCVGTSGRLGYHRLESTSPPLGGQAPVQRRPPHLRLFRHPQPARLLFTWSSVFTQSITSKHTHYIS